MAWAINTKLGTHILYSSHSVCIDPEVKRSKVKLTQLRKTSQLHVASAACFYSCVLLLLVWVYMSVWSPMYSSLMCFLKEFHIITYLAFFLQIVEVEQPFDRVKNQRRAFIFITYESEDIVEQVVANPKQTVGGKEVKEPVIDITRLYVAAFADIFLSVTFVSDVLLFLRTFSADFITTLWRERLIWYSECW